MLPPGEAKIQPEITSKASDAESSSFSASVYSNSLNDKNSSAFCIIEGPETVQDFAKMELQEIQDNILSRRNKIFLQMEEVLFGDGGGSFCRWRSFATVKFVKVRRLRIQQRIKRAELGIVKENQESELPSFPSFIPFLPPLNSSNMKQYYATCFSLIAGFMLFGGLLAPTSSNWVWVEHHILIYQQYASSNAIEHNLIQSWHHSREEQWE